MTRWVPRAWLIDTGIVAIAAADAWFDADDTTTAAALAMSVACIGLFLRRQYPLLTYLSTLPAAVLLPIVVAPMVALFTLAERTRNRPLLGICVVAAAFAATTPWPPPNGTDQVRTIVLFLYLLAGAAAPVLLGQLVQAHNDLSARLVEIEESRDHEQQLNAQAVLARERAQIGREMHDVVSHQVSLIAVQAGALQVATTDPHTREAARTIRQLGVDTLDELRHMITLLRASGIDSTELRPQPTIAGLHGLLDSSGIHVQLIGDLPQETPAPEQRAIYRTVQEALTNVRKHAPGATATVELWHDSNRLGLTITNTAPTRPSLTLPGSRHGLVGLTERAELLAGALRSGPTPDGGYRVELSLPIS